MNIKEHELKKAEEEIIRLELTIQELQIKNQNLTEKKTSEPNWTEKIKEHFTREARITNIYLK